YIFVAGFIGTTPTNFIEGTVTGGKPLKFEFDGRVIELGDLSLDDAPSEVVLGIRPEDVEITEDGELEGEVYVIEPLGRELLVTISLDGLHIKAGTGAESDLRMGQRVKFKIPPEKVYLFDKATGESLL
ncbi:MAG: TOBE domain-containing protein, partial [Candidatus Korarchaeota archaeon]|nr:TOBE domain-containing protein [Candidatus Korarchaeota archaeon]